MGDAVRAIQRDEADVMISGGAEAALTEIGLASFCALKALSRRNDEPTRASRPFDLDRAGFVLSEVGFVELFSQAGSAVAGGGANPFTHEEYGWTFMLFWGVFAIAGCTLWQPVAQRMLAVERPK